MDKKITKRFVVFNMLIISTISIVLGGLVYFGSKSTLSPLRLILSIVIMIGLVMIGSILLSKIAIAPIRKAWQKQLDFTADASHELKTPLTVIRTNLELVMDNPNNTIESQAKWLNNIEIENQRMAHLVDGLLILSRADTKQTLLDKRKFVLNELIASCIETFSPSMYNKQINCEFEAKDEIIIIADKQRIQQLILILLDNATKYTMQKGEIKILVKNIKDKIQLVVSDSGVGLEKKDVERVFDRFYRAEHTRSMYQEGSGLGLSIAWWIVNEHGGKITVESILGEGTSFIIEIPNEAR